MFPGRREIMFHLQDRHSISLVEQTIEFSSIEEFNDWKEKLEEKSVCNYIKVRTSNSKNGTLLELACARSGYYKKNEDSSKSRKRLWHKKTKKINGFCPSRIMLTRKSDDNLFNVAYIETHLGHDKSEQDLAYIRLPKKNRDEIARKIAAGIPYSRIRKDISKDIKTSDNATTKLMSIKNQDIRNIATSYKLKPPPKVEDASSVDSFVLECGNWVRYYKKQGVLDVRYPQLKKDDVLLIIMTPLQEQLLSEFFENDLIAMNGTREMNSQGFVLHTILVVDEYRESIPVCFAISNRYDETVIDTFLSFIKENIGIISVSNFMTDMQDAYYNSWIKVMPHPSHYFYCTRHIRDAWSENLNKIQNTGQRNVFHKKLLMTASETDRGEFNKKICHLMNDDTDDYQEFIQYFRSNYIGSLERWANCYRSLAGANTNMCVESFHTALKYWFENTNEVKQLHVGLKVLKDYLQQQMRDQKQKTADKLSSKLKAIQQHHDSINNEKDTQVIVEEISENSWLISSFQTPSDDHVEMHSITRAYPGCENCSLRCEKCDVCFHEYYCSCVDSCVNSNMCKHVHYLCSEILRNVDIEFPINIPCDYVELVYESITTAPVSSIEMKNVRNFESKKRKLLSEFEAILNMVESEEQLDMIKNTLISLTSRPQTRKAKSTKSASFHCSFNASS